tara:strand:+ start:1756 stop:1953 length:198 start_codon:yes stop_codon:yes gene_type:complete
MAICVKCYLEYPEKRKRIGYKTCIVCGDKEATKEAIRKSKCTAPLFNKGAYQYVGNINVVKDIGR